LIRSELSPIRKLVNVTYERPPVEGEPFRISAQEVAGSAKFKVYLNDEILWEHDCPDPPCHEQLMIPTNVAGSTLLVEVKDNREQHELVFFINDDGRGMPGPQRILEFSPAASAT
jgi:hypothetical protein